MSGPGIFTAELTVAQIEALECARYFEADLATEAGTSISVAHPSTRRYGQR